MADSIAGLRPDGRLVLMGFENRPLPVHPGDLISRRIRILGSQQNGRQYLYEALQIAASRKVKVDNPLAIADLCSEMRFLGRESLPLPANWSILPNKNLDWQQVIDHIAAIVRIMTIRLNLAGGIFCSG
jgi:hypothetical protein